MNRLHQVSRDEAEAPIVKLMYVLLFGDRDPGNRQPFFA